MRVKRNGAPVATTGAANKNFNQHDEYTSAEPECEYFGQYQLVSSMQCLDCSKSSACTLRTNSLRMLEKERRRKARARSVSYLVRLGYPRNQVEAHIDERDGCYE